MRQQHGCALENYLTQQQPIIISLIDNSLAIFFFPRGNRALYGEPWRRIHK